MTHTATMESEEVASHGKLQVLLQAHKPQTCTFTCLLIVYPSLHLEITEFIAYTLFEVGVKPNKLLCPKAAAL